MQVLDSELNPTSTVHLAEYIGIVKRRAWIIFAVLIATVIVGLVVSIRAKAVYEASSELLVDEPAVSTTSQVDVNNPLSTLFAPDAPQSLSTQIELLQDSPLVEKACELNGPAIVSVAAVADTNVIQVTADSNSQTAAAGVPNTLLRLYIQDRADKSLAGINAAIKSTDKQREAASEALAAANAALLRFKTSNSIADLTQSQSAEISRLEAATNQKYAIAKSLADTESEISYLQSQAKVSPGIVDQQDRASDASVTQIESSINALKVQRAGMVQPGGFTGKAPQVLALDAQIAASELALREQPKATDFLKEQANGYEAQLRDNQQELSAASARLAEYPRLAVTMDQLVGAHDGAANKLKMFTDSEQSLLLRKQAYRADSHIVQLASTPDAPIRPNRRQIVVFSVFLGLFLGVCAALGLDLLDDRIKSTEDAQRVLALPTIGRIPLIPMSSPRLLSSSTAQDYLSESFRLLRASISFASIDKPLRTIVFTSAGIGEGKTTTLANVAVAMAMDGKRVAVVDADLRRPSIHTILETPRAPGLTDVLSGACTLEDAWLAHDPLSGLSVLTAGSIAPNPAELLNSKAFAALLERIKAESDIVLIDGPPMIVADAQVLASQMDGTVLVVEPGTTTKTRAKRCVELLASSHAHVIGMVLNKAEIPQSEYLEYSQYSDSGKPNRKLGSTRRAELTGPRK